MTSDNLTHLLNRWSAGEAEVAGELLPLIYDELHKVAEREFRRERAGHTLQATAVVHEVFLELARVHGLRWENRSQFFGFAAHLARRVLVAHARSRGLKKRGGGSARVSLTEAEQLALSRPVDLVALDDALNSLVTVNRRLAEVVELRFFGGLSLEETATYLGVSAMTVSRDWRRAKAWLFAELGSPRRERDVFPEP